MAQARKFGWFAGVFTPSILTILGVIMYLRLPSIVGQAGLATTVGIIVVAHVISVCTGLSVASIATDKKVEAGGTYYMISRSLGLPIGGTLGLALFVGLMLLIGILTNIVSNNAAAVIGTPIAVSIASQMGQPAEPFVLAVLFGANMSYATPMAYKTNLLVMNAGKYTFNDFLRVGVPMVLIMWGTLSWLLPTLYGIK